MHEEKRRRARRRASTLKIARRRRLRHLRESHPEYLRDPRPENVDCVCETATWYFQCQSRRHRCGKRLRGRPKIGYGMCHGASRRSTVATRIQGRREEYALVSGRQDPEETVTPRMAPGSY